MAPLRRAGFRLLVAGELVSNLGDAVFSVALSWYVLAAHRGAFLLGIVLAAYGIPRTVFLVFGGRASDRWRPWTAMLLANGIRAVATGALAVTALLGAPREAVLIVIAGVLGAGEGVFLPGSFAIVPALVDDDELHAGNALTLGAAQLSALVGPALGGLVVALASPSLGFAIDAGSFVVSALTLASIRSRKRATDARVQPEAPNLSAGSARVGRTPAQTPSLYRLLVNEPILIVILVTDVLTNLGSSGMGRIALPALARGSFHAGAGGYGALLAAMGTGLLLGTAAAMSRPRVSRPLLVSSLTLLGAVPCIAAVPYLGGTLGAGAVLLVAGGLEAVGNLLMVTACQRWAPKELLGRVMSVLLLASLGVLPVSVLLAGLVVTAAGPAVYFPLAAASVALASALQLCCRSWREFGDSGGPARSEGRFDAVTMGD